MNKKIIVIGIILIFFVVIISGCNESNNSSSDNINRFIGTWEYVNTTVFFTMRYTFYENGTVFQSISYWTLNNIYSLWFKYDIKNGKLCFEYIKTNISGCMTYKFSENYTFLTLESMNESGYPVIFRKIPYETSDNKQFKINFFDISPRSITEGSNAVLTWDVSNADSVSIDNGIGIVELKGSLIVSPTEDTNYTLTAFKDNMTKCYTVFLDVIQDNMKIEYASVVGEGTDDQIKLVLASCGDDYYDGYNIANDVGIFIDGYKVNSYTSTIWEVGGQLLFGLSGSNWLEGGTCPKDDYEVTVSIKNTVVFDGIIAVG